MPAGDDEDDLPVRERISRAPEHNLPQRRPLKRLCRRLRRRPLESIPIGHPVRGKANRRAE